MKVAGQSVLSSNIEFIRQNNNRYVRKVRKKKSIKVNTLNTIMIMLIMLIIGGIVYSLGLFILNWEKLNINSYQLINVPKREFLKVKGILSEFRGNILAVDLEILKGRLHSVRTIKDVAIQRSLPSTLIVEFVLRKPVYQCYYQDEYLVLSQEGVILDELKNKNSQFILLNNVDQWNRDLLKKLYAQIDGIKDKIEYVDLHDLYGITIKLKSQKEIFYPGERNISTKINFYLKIKNKIDVNHSMIKCVDLRFKDRIYLEFEKEDLVNEKK